jgi:GntR family transcriptional regulator, transcriptional repressor for pyruvate dehydrogenase complex
VARRRQAGADLSLTPAPRQKLTETIAKRLLDEIRERGLVPGTRMPSERELVAALGVGRSTVREALNGLAMLGVVEIRHGEGAFVAKDPAVLGATDGIAAALEKGVTQTLLEARRPIEVEIARLAAIRRTQRDIIELRRVLEAHERAVKAGRPAARPSARFHTMLSDTAHNELLAGFVASYSRLLTERGPKLEAIEGYPEWELQEHGEIFAAVESGDEKRAAQRMQRHLDGVTDYYRRLGWPLDDGDGGGRRR